MPRTRSLTKARTPLHQQITENILAQLEKGAVPWVRPWKRGVGSEDTPPIGLPTNEVSAKAYTGINILLLWAGQTEGGYGSSRWLTFRQAKERGGHVRKGERGQFVIFTKWHNKVTLEDENGQESTKTVPLLRAYTVFNTEQCEGLKPRPEPKPKPVAEMEANAQEIIAATGARVLNGGDVACYETRSDRIRMPPPEAFPEPLDYTRTLVHELAHWTGHESRLARKFGQRFGDDAYAREELVAEMGAAFTCADLGIEPCLRHADYLASWLQVLKADSRAILRAASAASKAAAFLLGARKQTGEAQ